MDSPLLPQFGKQHLPDVSLLDDPSLLADLSLDSDLPDSSTSNHHLFTDEPQRRTESIFSSTSSSSYKPNEGGRRVHIENEGEEDTPVKNTNRNKGGSKPRFSLFAPQATTFDDEEEEEDRTIHHRPASSQPAREGDALEAQEQGAEEHAEDEGGHRQGQGQRQRSSVDDHTREDRLRSSLYELRKMNEVFEGVLGALEGVRGHNQRLAERVRQTSALLDEYTAIMGQAEHTQRLLLNPKWTGSADDAEALAAIEQARIMAIQQAEEESRRAAEAARLAEEERERRIAERERAESSRGGRGRGGFGLSAGGRGVPRGSTVRGRGTGIPRPSVTTSRPTSTTGIKRGTTTTSSTRGAGGLGGQYNHVKSSGYGPRG
ncbi:hypothetical protein I302_100774 [Kwoniella bestiolae CBS 10118]|uniref:DASH complex subunit DUO1 n=1 Tax=Kwoniella bestiolae CBS 10118 TaxID=1296100 RepID=A0A1B9G643_9TREE|nr:hypothetical protein I302_04147 [Kwoniella bestiolae CBS 10118]OCF26462.1 hypothetical protein I302_04147 [Kwoniella bestiolae CBS 10118]